jgi:hypothetical protein
MAPRRSSPRTAASSLSRSERVTASRPSAMARARLGSYHGWMPARLLACPLCARLALALASVVVLASAAACNAEVCGAPCTEFATPYDGGPHDAGDGG